MRNSPNDYKSFMSSCLKSSGGDMTSCAAEWQSMKSSKKSSNSDMDPNPNFPVLPGVIGFGLGAGCGCLVKEYYNIPVPFLSDYVPVPWNTYGTLGMFLASGAALVGSFFTKSTLKSGLLGLAIGAALAAVYNGCTASLSAQNRSRLAPRPRPRLHVSKPPRVTPYSSVQPGCLQVRESGLLGGVESEKKYSQRIVVA